MLLGLLTVAGAALAQDTGAPANPGRIALVEWPDEYCADAIGGSVEPGEILQAHTCHGRGGVTPEDQEFTTDYPNAGNIHVTQADLCIEAARLVAGGRLVVSTCSASDRRQMWVSSEDGQIHPASDTSLCWTVEQRPPAAPGNHKRDLTLEPCADVGARFATWSIPGGSVGSP
jgi:hypothetical protein